MGRRVDLPLAGIVLGGFALAAFFALRASEWVVMTDELVFAKAGLSVADGFSPFPAVRGESLDLSNRLYPLVTAPAWGLLDAPGAFRAIHLLNALLLASTAVPAYLLARSAGATAWGARTAAALTVVVPWLAYAMVVMTEPLAYAVFAWTLLAIYRAVDAPSVGRDLVALAAIAASTLTRTQFVVLLVAFAGAALLVECAQALSRPEHGGARALARGVSAAGARHVGAFAGLAGAFALALFVLWLMPHDSLDNVLIKTGYLDTVEGSLLPSGTARSAAAHIAYIALGSALIPMVVATGWAFSTTVRPGPRRELALAALLLTAIPVMTLTVTSFNLRFATLQVQDRYLFYVVPLFFCGMAVCLSGTTRRPWAGVAIAGGLTAWFMSLASFEHTVGELPRYASPDAVFHRVIDGRADQVGKALGIGSVSPRTAVVAATVLVTAGAVAALIRVARRRLLIVLAAPALAFGLVQTVYVLDQFERNDASANWGVGGSSVTSRDWIDDALGDGVRHDDVALVPAPFGDLGSFAQPALWWDTEFWNKTVGAVYSFEDLEYDTLPKRSLEIPDQLTGLLVAQEGTGTERFLVVSSSDARFRPRGHDVASSRPRPGYPTLSVVEPERPWRADWIWQGLTDDGFTLAGQAGVVRIYPSGSRRQRRVRVELESPRTADVPFRFRLGAAGGSTARGSVEPQGRGVAELTVCVPARAHRDLDLVVGGSTNLPEKDEQVGLRVVETEVGPPGRRC